MSRAITGVGFTIASSDLPVDHTIVHILRNIDDKAARFTHFHVSRFPERFLSTRQQRVREHLLNRFIPRSVKCSFNISKESYAPLETYLSVVLELDFLRNKFTLVFLSRWNLTFFSSTTTAAFILRRSFLISQLRQALIIIVVVTSFTDRSDLSILINISVGHNFNLSIFPRGNFFAYS